MGCWNGTCMVTNLPILANDPVICQVIVQAPFFEPIKAGETRCHSGDRFQPLGYPFRAKYNDYGYVEDIEEDLFTSATLEYIRANMIEREQGTNPYHDMATTREALTWDSFGDWIHDGRLLLRNKIASGYDKYPLQLPVGMAMIHEGVYQTMSVYEGEGWNYERLVESISEALAVDNTNIVGQFRSKALLEPYTRDRALGDIHTLMPAVGAVEMQRRLTEMFRFEGALGASRNHWHVISGSGSQSEEWLLYGDIMAAADKIMRKRRAEIEEMDAEEAAEEAAFDESEKTL